MPTRPKMNREILTEFFNYPDDTNRNNVMYVKLWCKERIHKFIEKYMDESNYKTFTEWFKLSSPALLSFYEPNWLTDDTRVYNLIIRDLRQLSEASNTNVRILARFARMNFFTNFVMANKDTTGDLYNAFESVYNDKGLYLNKKINTNT